ncbi:MAG: chorismate mutase [Kiritimatiellae bacterium]|nr:chorismate mutase [Kiritimatiellia bacterium]
MKDISEIRDAIDAIDGEIAELYLKRMKIIETVAESKRERGAPVADPARERQILSRVTEAVGETYENGARLLFTTLFGITKARQRVILNGEGEFANSIRRSVAETRGKFPLRALVACPGVEGAYAQQAASRMFPLPTIVYFNDFEKIFEAVEKGLCPYGILPIENSAAGSVAAVYDLMQKHRFHIVRSLKLKIDHVLLAPKGTRLSDVKVIESHPHALAQCSEFFRAHSDIEMKPAINTATAAEALAANKTPGAAVIASRTCAELYGLEVIAESIQNAALNYTRFICIAKNPEIYSDANKISVMLSLPHRPGSLNDIIAKFSAINVNLTKLESRPVPGMDFEFRFIFEFEASISDPSVLSLLADLAADPEIDRFTFLGAYSEK